MLVLKMNCSALVRVVLEDMNFRMLPGDYSYNVIVKYIAAFYHFMRLNLR